MKSNKPKGFTLYELLIVLAMGIIPLLMLIPIFIYDGERDVNGVTVDCIGLQEDGAPLPPGYIWKTEVNPILPSFFILAPVGPIVTALTDAKCPAEVVNIPQ